MNDLRSFLESSTIHGLTYISTTGKYVRLFWIFVVFIGFSVASFLIYQSFQSWEESPVKTTIETLPIAKITLPKVTVCPPKNTFTNLNYDLLMLKDMALNNDSRNELTQYAVGLIQDHVYNDIMTNISLLEEENRYYNWYMGYTFIRLPWWGKRDCDMSECGENRLRYHISTYVTSGVITTHLFGEKFDAEKIEKDFKYFLYVLPPHKQREDKSISLHFEIETNFMHEFDRIFDGEKYSSDGNITIKEYSPPESKQYVSIERRISGDHLNELELITMPGVRIKWYYNEELVPASYTKYNEETNSYSEFKR